jgi:hypothetical protein
VSVSPFSSAAQFDLEQDHKMNDDIPSRVLAIEAVAATRSVISPAGARARQSSRGSRSHLDERAKLGAVPEKLKQAAAWPVSRLLSP